MTNQQILEKAIQKAIDGGYKHPSGKLTVDEHGTIFVWVDGATDGIRAYGHDTSLREIIFNHDFAKALWGEYAEGFDSSMYSGTTGREFGPAEPWKSHLREMVISEDPIKYLGENI